MGMHFGHCDVYTIVEIEDGMVKKVFTLPSIPHQQGGCLAPVQYLADHGVCTLLAGSMGAAASLAWFTAYAMQGAAEVRTLGMVEVVFSYLVSRRLLSESFTRPEKLGMALMLVGLVLISLQGL